MRFDRSSAISSTGRFRPLHQSGCYKRSLHAQRVQIPDAAHSDSLLFDEILLDMGIDHAVALKSSLGGGRGLQADQRSTSRLATVPLASCIVVGEGAIATAHARHFPDALMDTLSLISMSGQPLS